MALKAIIPSGQTEITVNGLHQWDYGRTIEIHADGLPAMVEVHFACAGMSEAVVRSCSVIDGAVTAAVPDMCLEQTTPIAAWVYAVGETNGATILTITLPITPRTRPQPSATVPEEISDKYTEAVAAMGALVAECEQTVANAKKEIKTELQQEISNGALAVAEATHAATADIAYRNEKGWNLAQALIRDLAYSEYFRSSHLVDMTPINPGVVMFRVAGSSPAFDVRVMTEVGGNSQAAHASPVFYGFNSSGVQVPMRLVFTYEAEARQWYIDLQEFNGTTWLSSTPEEDGITIYYRHLLVG